MHILCYAKLSISSLEGVASLPALLLGLVAWHTSILPSAPERSPEGCLSLVRDLLQSGPQFIPSGTCKQVLGRAYIVGKQRRYVQGSCFSVSQHSHGNKDLALQYMCPCVHHYLVLMPRLASA